MALFDLIPQPFVAGFVTSEAELRAFDYTLVGDGNLLLVQLASGRTAFVQWSATSLSPDDPDRGCVRPTAIIVTDPGRWLWYDYAALAPPKGAPGGQIGNTWASPDVRGIRASDGTLLTFGAIEDGQAIIRAGAVAAGSYLPPGGVAVQSVRLATTANLAVLSGPLTVDGVVSAVGNLVLVKNQATASQNGVYVVAAGTWPRAPQANSDATLRGAQYSVREGTANGSRMFVNTNTTVITVGTTALTYGILGRLGTAVTPVSSSGLGNTPGTSLDASPADHRHQVTGALFGATALTFATPTANQVLGVVGTQIVSQTTLLGRLLALSQVTQTQAAAATINWTTGHKQLLNMTGNVALTFTSPGGPTNLTLVLVQDATGGRSPTWPATVRAASSQIRVATAPNAVTVVSMYFDGTNYWMDSAPGLTGSVTTLLV